MSSLLKVSGTQKEAYLGGRNGVRMSVMTKSGLGFFLRIASRG